MSEKKRDRIRRWGVRSSDFLQKVLSGIGLSIVFLFFLFFGELYDLLVSQTGAIALTFVMLILETIVFFKQINAARYLKNKRSVLVALLGFGSVFYAFMVASLQPVEDWWYYLGAIICLCAASAMSIDLILRYNETSTRPLPSFYSRKGGNDRA